MCEGDGTERVDAIARDRLPGVDGRDLAADPSSQLGCDPAGGSIPIGSHGMAVADCHLRARDDVIDPSEVRGARCVPLDLAARCLRHRARSDQHDLVQSHLL